jgi:hypothetical protein
MAFHGCFTWLLCVSKTNALCVWFPYVLFMVMSLESESASNDTKATIQKIKGKIRRNNHVSSPKPISLKQRNTRIPTLARLRTKDK